MFNFRTGIRLVLPSGRTVLLRSRFRDLWTCAYDDGDVVELTTHWLRRFAKAVPTQGDQPCRDRRVR